MRTVTVKLREDQVALLAKFLGDHHMGDLPRESAGLICQVHHGLRAVERNADVHTLDLTEWNP